MDTDQVTSLEIKVAYLEDFLSGLQEVVLSQGKDIEKLKAEKEAMKKKVKELSDTLEGDIPQERPPHY